MPDAFLVTSIKTIAKEILTVKILHYSIWTNVAYCYKTLPLVISDPTQSIAFVLQIEALAMLLLVTVRNRKLQPLMWLPMAKHSLENRSSAS